MEIQEKLSIFYLIDTGKWNTINGKAIRIAEPFFCLYEYFYKAGEEMINFNSSKTKKTISAIIIFILIIAMILPSVITIFTM